MRLLTSLAAVTFVIVAAGCSGRERTFRIPGSSMEPTLHCARPAAGCTADVMDHVRIRPDLTPARGDIVVFEVPPHGVEACTGIPGGKTLFVKRVIGLPGETWSERAGYIYINGRLLSEPYIEPTRRDSDTLPPRKLPAASYLILGDNRSSSCDSRRWGPLPRKNLVGTVVAILRGDSTIKVG